MKIFTDDDKSLIKELDFLKDSFTKVRRLTDNIEMLESFYQVLIEVNGKADKEAEDLLIKNDEYRDLRFRERRMLHRRGISNFIDHKDFHKYASGKMIDISDKDYEYYINKSLYLKEDQMCEIICDFLNDEFNQADKFKKMISEGRIFTADIIQDEDGTLPTCGYTMFDYLSKNNFIVLKNDNHIRDVETMRILVHEFGHVIDNIEKDSFNKSELANYNYFSGYIEVYSIMYEKLFYDYLIKKRIIENNAKWSEKNLYSGIYDDFNSVEYLSNLDDYLLTNDRYKRDENFIDQISFEDLTVSRAVLDDFDDINQYSYGGLIGCYFASLRHEDLNEFNRQFEIFKSKRAGQFDPKLFEAMGTNIDEVIKKYEKGLDEITNKKLILKNNTNF